MPVNPTQHDDAQREDDLESIASRIADEQPVNWSGLAEADTTSLNGLREIERIARGFRHLQASAIAPHAPAASRFRFGALQALEPLGSGAQGEVWRAYDPMLDLQVALKLRKAGSDALSHRFLDEARRLARVRQANIVSVYGAAVHGGRAGLWTELVRGSSLADLLRDHGPFPADEVRGIGLDLCHALAAVHRHGLVHGDVKAENVMREVSGRIVLMDFGAARELDGAQAGGVSGTLRYLAPEVLRGAEPSPASDIYALGVLLFHLLSGAYPYSAGTLDELLDQQQRGARVRLDDLRSGLPRDLVDAIGPALAADPARRPASALAFAAALAPKTTAEGSMRLRALVATVAVAAAALFAGLAWYRTTPSWQAETEFHRVGTTGESSLADGAPIALGDRLVMRFHSNRRAYVYVFDDDGSGTTGVLFPLPGIEPANPLAADTSYRLPGRRNDESLAWTVSSHAAREEFVVVAATAPQPELEHAIAGWQRARGVDGARRGAMGLAPVPDDADIGSASLRRVLDGLGHEQGVRRWRFVFPHAPGS